MLLALEELRVPKFMSDLKDKKANKGAKTFFTIKCRSEPPPEVKWYLNGAEVVESDNIKVSFKEEEHQYRLDILDVQSNTAGELKVVAKNENGEDEKVGSLEVQFSPEIDRGHKKVSSYIFKAQAILSYKTRVASNG